MYSISQMCELESQLYWLAMSRVSSRSEHSPITTHSRLDCLGRRMVLAVAARKKKDTMETEALCMGARSTRFGCILD